MEHSKKHIFRNATRCLRPKLFKKAESGFTFIETLVALGLLGVVIITILTGISTSSKILMITDEKETAKNLAESQLEHIKGLTFASSYIPTTIPAEYGGYSVDSPILAENVTTDGNLQKIKIVVRHGDREILLTPDATATLEGYKVR